MEELAHHLLRHKPCSNATDPLPASLSGRTTAEEIAATHGCSEKLVTYRIKRMRLWQRYEKYAA